MGFDEHNSIVATWGHTKMDMGGLGRILREEGDLVLSKEKGGVSLRIQTSWKCASFRWKGGR